VCSDVVECLIDKIVEMLTVHNTIQEKIVLAENDNKIQAL